jgi:hypothetical protein
MPIKLFRRVNWHLRQGANRLGFAGIAGLVVLALCAMLQLATVQPMHRQLAELQARARANPPAQIRAKPEDAVAHLQKQLTAFYQFFPERGDMAGQVDNLFAAAKRYHLVLENGSYALTRGDAHKLARCEVQLPIKGSYLQTRKFLADVLLDMPNVALDTINFQRSKISDASVDAQIKLTLYYRES